MQVLGLLLPFVYVQIAVCQRVSQYRILQSLKFDDQVEICLTKGKIITLLHK